MAVLARLREPVDAFFDKVTVNDPDPEAHGRASTCSRGCGTLVDGVADFSKIEG